MQILEPVIRWFDDHPAIVWSVAGVSAAMFVAALVLLPWLVIRIPHDYFSHRRPPALPWQSLHPALRTAAILVKNLVGAVLLLAGLVMLFTPGQGILAMLIGLALLDVPGKRSVERWIVARPSVFNAINKLRARHGIRRLEHPYDR